MAQVIIETNEQHIFSPYNWARIALIGAVLGVATLGLSWLLATYVIDPLLCRSATLAACARSDVMAANIASVITATAGSWLLIRLLVHRALLVAVATVITFWNFTQIMTSLSWFEIAGSMAILYAFAYLVFTNLFRIRSIFVSSIATIIAILLMRWIAFL